MKKVVFVVMLLLGLGIFSSCEKEKVDFSSMLVGDWAVVGRRDDGSLSKTIVVNTYFSFKQDGSVIEYSSTDRIEEDRLFTGEAAPVYNTETGELSIQGPYTWEKYDEGTYRIIDNEYLLVTSLNGFIYHDREQPLIHRSNDRIDLTAPSDQISPLTHKPVFGLTMLRIKKFSTK